MHEGSLTYPILGVGAFFAMFWVGFLLAYELGLACPVILLTALMSAIAGSYFIVRLERWERGDTVPGADAATRG